MSKDTTPVPASGMTRIKRVSEVAPTDALRQPDALRQQVIDLRWRLDTATEIIKVKNSDIDALRGACNSQRERAETAERDLADARREQDELREIIAAAAAEKDTLRSQASAAEHRQHAAEHRAQRIVLDAELKARAEAAEVALARLRAKIRDVSQNARERGARRAGSADSVAAAKGESALIANEIDDALTEADAAAVPLVEQTPDQVLANGRQNAEALGLDAVMIGGPVEREIQAEGTVSPAPAPCGCRVYETCAICRLPASGTELLVSKAEAIGGGHRPVSEDNSQRAWACGCYEDQDGYHLCATHLTNVRVEAHGPVPEGRPLTIKGIDGFADEILDCFGPGMTRDGAKITKDHIRTILLAFTAHVRRQVEAASPGAGPAPQDDSRVNALRDAIAAVAAEHLEDPTSSEGDQAYDAAIDHAIHAIAKLLGGQALTAEPHGEPG